MPPRSNRPSRPTRPVDPEPELDPGTDENTLPPEDGLDTGADPGADGAEGEVDGPPAGATVVTPSPSELEGTDPGQTLPPGGETVVYSATAPKKPAAPAAKLVVLKGVKKGAEFSLGPGDSSVGRQNDNTIVIPDISVSRKHVVLRSQGRGYLVIDQGSGNGTFVNGQPAEEQELHNGDVISLGDSELQFVELGGVAVKGQPTRREVAMPPPRRTETVTRPPAARRSGSGGRAAMVPAGGTNQMVLPRGARPSRRGRTVLIGVLAVVVVGLGGVALVQRARRQAVLDAQRREELREQRDVMQRVAQLKEEGKKFAGEKRWDLALPKFKEAAEYVEGDEELATYVKRAELETPIARALAEADKLLAEGNLVGAAGALAKVETDQTVLADDVEAARRKVAEEVTRRVADLKTAIASRDPGRANEILKVVAGADPTHAELASLTAQVAALAPVPTATVAPEPVGPSTPALVNAADKAKDQFRAGDLDGAIVTAASQPRAAGVLAELNAFKSFYANLEAPGNLEKALRLGRQLGGDRNKFTIEIGGRAANIYYRQGLSALTADNPAKAYAAFKRCNEANPGHADCKNQLFELCNRAKQVYMEGYVDRQSEPDAARRKFDQVLNQTGPDCEWYGKAKRQLQGMGLGPE